MALFRQQGLSMIPVSVVTRLHQASLFMGLAGAFALPALVVWLELPIWLMFVGFFGGLIAPPVLIFRYFPRKDFLTIERDRLTFQRRKPILYSDIDRYNTDDYLKLIRSGKPTLLLHVSKPLEFNYQQLSDQFVAAFEAWRDSQIALGIKVKARRTYFYGSHAAKMIGAAMIAVSVLGGIFALVMLRNPPYGAMGILVVGIGFGIAMVSKRGPGDEDEDEDEARRG
jgi:hypothetical protein